MLCSLANLLQKAIRHPSEGLFVITGHESPVQLDIKDDDLFALFDRDFAFSPCCIIKKSDCEFPWASPSPVSDLMLDTDLIRCSCTAKFGR